jgi:hypothetical protein
MDASAAGSFVAAVRKVLVVVLRRDMRPSTGRDEDEIVDPTWLERFKRVLAANAHSRRSEP